MRYARPLCTEQEREDEEGSPKVHKFWDTRVLSLVYFF